MKELLTALCKASGVSGGEQNISACIAGLLAPYAKVKTDSSGSVFALLGNENANRTILLDAHMDQIGLIVTEICKNGFIRGEKCGGTDLRTLPGTGVVIHGKNDIRGIVCCLPPHLSDGKEDKAMHGDKIYIDTGFSAETVSKNIAPGDFISFCEEPSLLLNGRIASPALDNRAGVAALIRAAELLSQRELDCKVLLLFSCQEEVTMSGAKTGAYKLFADEAVTVDVSFASQPGVEGQYGSIELGKGPMICYAPTLDRKMTDRLFSVAEKQGISVQKEVASGSTGTNADPIAVTKGGIRTALVSIPERSMHTQCEVISIADAENTARLLSEYILQGGILNEQ